MVLILQRASGLVNLDSKPGLQLLVHVEQVVNRLHTPDKKTLKKNQLQRANLPLDDLLLRVFDALSDVHCVEIARPPSKKYH